MGKKKFSAGLDSIFGEDVEQTIANITINVAEEEVAPTASKRSSTKNFTSDLDLLFQEALTDAVEEKARKMTGLGKKNGADDTEDDSKNRFKKPLSGLDALIRQTVDSSLAQLEQSPIKRITFTFEHQKLEKLKQIAKQERSYLKDIVQSVIADFISDYEKRHGAA